MRPTCSRLVTVALVLVLASPAHAQAPRAGAPTAVDGEGSRVAVDLGITGNLSRGLVYRDLITNRGVLQLWDGPWGIYIQPYWLFSRIGTAAGRVTADNDIYVRLGSFYNVASSVFVTVVNVYDHSLRRRVEHRDLFGAGAGLNLIRHTSVVLATSTALLGEVTDFERCPGCLPGVRVLANVLRGEHDGECCVVGVAGDRVARRQAADRRADQVLRLRADLAALRWRADHLIDRVELHRQRALLDRDDDLALR
jgi:hypothetical protein